MKSIIRWATHNAPAMNMLMIGTLGVGFLSMGLLRREMFPEFELDIVLVSVPYPGASPEEVEEGICQKIEESVRSVEGIKRQTSIAQEGAGFLILELEAGVNAQKILNEVRSEVDSIPSFPELSEEPTVKELTYRVPAINIGVIGEDSDDPSAGIRLREAAEQVRDRLVTLPTVSQAEILGVPEFQIDVEIPESRLREHGLTLKQVAQTIRRQNMELPGGTMRTAGQDILLRGKNKFDVGKEIAQLAVLEDPSGDVLTVEELGAVRDAFTDKYFVSQVDGRPGLVISINRTKSEDLLAMAEEVRSFIKNEKIEGYSLVYWADHSVDVKARLDMLIRNGLQGLSLVFLVLAVFLDLRLAFWVALGIPISVLGSGAILLATDQTLNMLSMFGFLVALGIVVDDAIVVGENIHKHREMDKNPLRAAIDGTYEVLPSVFASVATTIIAFLPLMFVSGVMGKFFAVMPLVVIAMLIISLFEAMLILPCHLSHIDSWIFRFFSVALFPLRAWADVFHRLSGWANRRLNQMIDRYYAPLLRWTMLRPAITLSIALAALLTLGGLIKAGVIPYVMFPKLDSRTIEARISFPDGTPGNVTLETTHQIEAALTKAVGDFGGGLLLHRYHMVGWTTRPNSAASIGGSFSGGHLGIVRVELVPPEEREVHSQQLINHWREVWQRDYAAQHPGIDSLVFAAEAMGPGGVAIEFKLLAAPGRDSFGELERAVETCKQELANHSGVIDIEDDSRPGKWEYQIKVKETAKALGITVADLAETVRSTYYGEEVMRLQRGRHEVKLMVRYPRAQRRSMADFDRIRVRTASGADYPLPELADITVKRGYSEINRRDQRRSITVSADVAEGANAQEVASSLKASFLPKLMEEHPGIDIRWEGEQETNQESVESLKMGFLVAMLAMYVLLTVEFRSYIQPLIILSIIPFGFIGAALGHIVMGLELTLLSVFGMIALTGVVINDSIVLVDFIDHRLESGMSLIDALESAGRRRFRPILLTSITTVAGLTPMLLERSFQGQILVPMATSLAFGLMLSTVLILVLVPSMYVIYARVVGLSFEPDGVDPEERAAPVNRPQPAPAADPEMVPR